MNPNRPKQTARDWARRRTLHALRAGKIYRKPSAFNPPTLHGEFFHLKKDDISNFHRAKVDKAPGGKA